MKVFSSLMDNSECLGFYPVGPYGELSCAYIINEYDKFGAYLTTPCTILTYSPFRQICDILERFRRQNETAAYRATLPYVFHNCVISRRFVSYEGAVSHITNLNGPTRWTPRKSLWRRGRLVFRYIVYSSCTSCGHIIPWLLLAAKLLRLHISTPFWKLSLPSIVITFHILLFRIIIMSWLLTSSITPSIINPTITFVTLVRYLEPVVTVRGAYIYIYIYCDSSSLCDNFILD